MFEVWTWTLVILNASNFYFKKFNVFNVLILVSESFIPMTNVLKPGWSVDKEWLTGG